MYNVAFFMATIGIIVIIVVGSLFIMSHLHYNMTPTETITKLSQDEGISRVGDKATGACQQTYANHQIVFSNGSVSPLHIQAQLCDTLTFISQDKTLHLVGFGPHPKHESYAGQDDLLVRKGQNQTITLNQAGSYNFHDHLNDKLNGDFSVTPR